MAPDDGARQIDEARQKLLEEIKRRAEEAELRRLEEENSPPTKSTRRQRQERKRRESAQPSQPPAPEASRQDKAENEQPPVEQPVSTPPVTGSFVPEPPSSGIPSINFSGSDLLGPVTPSHETPESGSFTGEPGKIDSFELKLPPVEQPARQDFDRSSIFQDTPLSGLKETEPQVPGPFSSEDSVARPSGEESGGSNLPPIDLSIPPPHEETSSDVDARIAELRVEFSRSIDLGNRDAARQILDECMTLDMERSEITSMQLILERLEDDLFATHPPSTDEGDAGLTEPELPVEAEPPGVSVSSEPEPPAEPAADPQQMMELLHQAEFNYQHERYAAAMETLASILSVDPGNADAQTLMQEVQRASELTERIAQEDARSRESLSASPAETPKQKEAPSEADVWGASVRPFDSTAIETLPGQEGPMPVRRPPLGSGLFPRLATFARFLRPLAIVVGVAVVVAVGYYLVRGVSSSVVPSRASIVILPGITTGGDPSLAQLADGFSDDVIRKLGMVADLQVIAPVSSYAAGASSWSPPQTARAVGASMCLTWNFSDGPSGFQIQQSLFDSSSSTPIWTKTMSFPDSSLNVERSEILDGLLTAIGVHAGEEEQVALHKIPTTRVEAYRSYLRGRAIVGHPDVYPLTNAIEEFGRAIAFDSLFAEAYAALGWTRILAYERGDTSGAQLSDAVACVQRAVSLGFRNAETFRAWGAIERIQGHFEKAAERFDQATQIAPSDAEARRRLALVQSVRGQIEQSITSAQRARKDDPLNPDSYILLGLLQKYSAIANGDNAEDFARALATFQAGEQYAKDRSDYASRYIAVLQWYLQSPDDAVAILSDHLARSRQSYESLYMLGRVQQAAGHPKQEWQDVLSRSKAALQAELRTKPGDPVLLSWLGLVETRLGEFKEALAASQRALATAPHNAEVLYNTARLYALQRNFNQAVDYLRKAVDREYDLKTVLDMDFFNLHGDQAYLKAIVR